MVGVSCGEGVHNSPHYDKKGVCDGTHAPWIDPQQGSLAQIPGNEKDGKGFDPVRNSC